MGNTKLQKSPFSRKLIKKVIIWYTSIQILKYRALSFAFLFRGADRKLQGGLLGVRHGREREHLDQGAGHGDADAGREPDRGRAAGPHQQV